jgi:uncharacterized OB-fold protein
MNSQEQSHQATVLPGWIIAPYTYTIGTVASKFFTELRDNKRILGLKCSQCKRVIVPPRSICDKCFSQIGEWVEVDSKGKLITYTAVHYSLPIHPAEHPFAYGIVRLNGASTGLPCLLGEVDLNKIEIGTEYEAVFREKREGNILDIKYFRPVMSVQ